MWRAGHVYILPALGSCQHDNAITRRFHVGHVPTSIGPAGARRCRPQGRREFKPQAYVDALELLNRSADFKFAADDRTTLMKLLSKQRQEFTERGATPPPEYTAMCDWLAAHGFPSE
jgi:hypothetical protein